MRLLDRYLLRELLIWLGFCLGGLLICVIAFSLFSELNKYQENKLVLADVLELYVVRIPEIVVLILPIALLCALLYVLTNHARHHEFTAIRAAGVSLWRICVPYVTVGLLLSVASFVMNELWVPDSAEKEEQIWARHQDKKPGAPNKDVQSNLPFENRRDGHTWLIGAYDFRTDVMTNLHVEWRLPNGANVLLLADRADSASTMSGRFITPVNGSGLSAVA